MCTRGGESRGGKERGFLIQFPCRTLLPESVCLSLAPLYTSLSLSLFQLSFLRTCMARVWHRSSLAVDESPWLCTWFSDSSQLQVHGHLHMRLMLSCMRMMMLMCVCVCVSLKSFVMLLADASVSLLLLTSLSVVHESCLLPDVRWKQVGGRERGAYV